MFKFSIYQWSNLLIFGMFDTYVIFYSRISSHADSIFEN